MAAKQQSEAQQLSTMTDREAVAYWNILQMNAAMLVVGGREKDERHGAIMDGILSERGIAHETGKRTEAVA